MGKRKRKREHRDELRQPTPSPSPPFNNPFGALTNLREELPVGARSSPRPQPKPAAAIVEEWGKLVIECGKKGRAGKTVTRVRGLPVSRLEELAQRMKLALGCGATLEGSDLILLGSLADRAAQWLEGEGAGRVVISGAKPAAAPKALSARNPTEAARSRSSKSGQRRSDLAPGLTVEIVLKQDQRTGALTRGEIQQLLTRSATHPHGIKVRLTNGQVGRVKHVIES